MHLVGCALIILGAALCVGAYRRYTERAIAEGEDFLKLLDRLYDGIFCYLKTPSEIICSSELPSLNTLGFVGLVKDGVDPSAAFEQLKEKLCLGEEQKELLSSFFKRIGGGYLENEIRSIDYTKKRFAELMLGSKESLAKRVKTVGAVSFAAALSLCIILI